MGYWFEDPTIKNLLPLASASGIRGLSSLFRTPMIIMGSNVFPDGPGIGLSTIDHINARSLSRKAFVISDEFSARFAERVVRFLTTFGYEAQTWSKILPEAPIENVKECSQAMSDYEPGLILAVGGGSVIDGAKGAWVMYERPDLTDLMNYSPIVPLGLRKKAVFAAVPTTAGTGSECTQVAIFHDQAFDRKIPISSNELVPDFAILFPDFTFSMPAGLTAGTGLDVMAHAMDAATAVATNMITDAVATTAIQAVFKYLPRAYANGRDREARLQMLIAASLGGIAINHAGASLTHCFGHTLGSLFHIHHGLAVGIFVPYCLQYYSRVSEKHHTITKALDIPGKTMSESLGNLVSKIRSLLAELNVPNNLKDLGIPEKEFKREMPRLVQYTLEDIDIMFSPRPMTEKQCEMFWHYVYQGKDIDF